jgi:hypothetical protein
MHTRVVQWTRMPDYELGGRKFDSCRAYQHQQGVAQLVERKVWDFEAVGSIPTTLTIVSRCETKKGRLAERLNAPDLKSVMAREPRREGSNPSSSTRFFNAFVFFGVAVAQLVEPLVVIQMVMGSNPIGHPKAHEYGKLSERINDAVC